MNKPKNTKKAKSKNLITGEDFTNPSPKKI